MFSVEDLKTGNYSCTFTLTGDIDGGLPSFKPPIFQFLGNGSSVGSEAAPGQDISFGDLVSHLRAAIIMIPIIAILEAVAIAKAFCKYIIVICRRTSLACSLHL